MSDRALEFQKDLGELRSQNRVTCAIAQGLIERVQFLHERGYIDRRQSKILNPRRQVPTDRAKRSGRSPIHRRDRADDLEQLSGFVCESIECAGHS